MGYTLGLDMGVASIGWAVVNEETHQLDSGVRIFPAGLDAINTGKESNINVGRRDARGMRRRLRRKAQRKLVLRQALEEIGWIPSSQSSHQNAAVRAWEHLDPYALRDKALREQLTLPELGRVMLHLHQRRGFLSLRKAQDNSNKDTKGILGEMASLEQAITTSGHQTLGSYLYHLREQDLAEHRGVPMARLIGRHLKRQLIYHEFDLIWQTQQQYAPSTLTANLRYGSSGVSAENPTQVRKPIDRDSQLSLLEQFGLENILFFQRKVYWPESSIGLCQLEHPLLFAQLQQEGLLDPTRKKERYARERKIQRAPIADRRFQEFRMLCEVNNLRLTNAEESQDEERPLTAEERELVLTYCYNTKQPSLTGVKNKLKAYLKIKSDRALHLNLENGGRTKISGMLSDAILAEDEKGLGKTFWQSLSEDQRNAVVQSLADTTLVDDELETDLTSLGFLDSSQVTRLMQIDLGSTRGNLSIIALEKLLPHLRNGMIYMGKSDSDRSALHAAGYERHDEQSHSPLSHLPRFDDPQYSFAQEINSPVVRRAMTELRKIVNGLIRKYGLPKKIHLEMARDLKMPTKKRIEHNKKTKAREKERESARKVIESIGLVANRDAIERYLLWQEQEENCIYSGRKISLSQLYEGEVDVDHIFPYSRSADNSYLNKVVCYRNENAEKSNQTPREWLEETNNAKYTEVITRARQTLPYNKSQKFTTSEIPEGFSQRDLNDTAWMATAARRYLAQLYPQEQAHCIQGSKGTHTALLRNHWQLNGLLRVDGIEQKSRDDHRHHAIDAVIIALTTPQRIRAITRHLRFQSLPLQPAKKEGQRIYRLKPTLAQDSPDLQEPWPKFRSTVATSLSKIWVSHRPSKKVSGALHKATTYGKTAEGSLVVRKNLADLSDNMLKNIRDKGISSLVHAHLASGHTLKDPLFMPSGVPIRRVRILVNTAHLTLREGQHHEAHVESGNTHHLSVFRKPDGKCLFTYTTLLEASQRKKNREPVYCSAPPASSPNATFMFHLSTRETILCQIDGAPRLFVYQTVASSTGQISFKEHTIAIAGKQNPHTKKSILRSAKEGTFLKNFPEAQKVNVLPTGELRRAQ